jgi:hypothetical protein
MLGFFLWQTLFASKENSQSPEQATIAQSKQQTSYENSFGGSPAPSTRNSTDETIAGYTKWLAIFTLFLVLANIGLFISGERNVEVARKSADAAGQAAHIAQQTLFFTTRPWIKVADISMEGDLMATRSQNSILSIIRLNYVLKNVGKSPAKNIKFDVISLPQGQLANTSDILSYHKQFCAASNAQRGERGLRYTLFPDDTLPIEDKSGFNLQDELAARMGSNTPQVFVCITYQFDFSDRIHTTGLLFTIYRGTKDRRSTNGISVPMDGEQHVIPQSELVIVPTPEADIVD